MLKLTLIQCFITSTVLVSSSCVHQHTYDVTAKRVLFSIPLNRVKMFPYLLFLQSMPILTEKIEKCESMESCCSNSQKPIWGQFHFFPNGSISEMNSRLVKQSNPYVSTSFTTTTLGTNVDSSFYSVPQWDILPGIQITITTIISFCSFKRLSIKLSIGQFVCYYVSFNSSNFQITKL